MTGIDVSRSGTDPSGRTSEATEAIPVSKNRYARYDGLRGLCAICVVIYHIGYEAGIAEYPGYTGPKFWGMFLPAFRIFLPPFFVLSATLLYRPFARAILADTPRPAARPFIVGRALRMLPGFWVLTVFVMLTLNLRSVNGVWYVLKPLLLVHYWLTPDLGQWMPAMEHTWTVPVEMSFYVFLPFCALLINRFARKAATPYERARRMLIPFGILVLIGTAWTFYCYIPSVANSNKTYWYLFFPFGYAGFFAAGMALATLNAYREVTGEVPKVHKVVARRPHIWWVFALCALALNTPRPFGPQGGALGDWGAVGQHMIEYTLFFVFGVCMVLPLTVPEVKSKFYDRVLTNRPLTYIGRLSYGIYLWNVPVMYLYFRRGALFGNPPLGMNDTLPLMPLWEIFWFSAYVFILTGILTVASWYLIERPALRLRTRWGAPKSALELDYSQQKA